MKLNKKTLYDINCYGGEIVQARLENRNGSSAVFRIVKSRSQQRWLGAGICISLWGDDVERRVSKAKPMMLENK